MSYCPNCAAIEAKLREAEAEVARLKALVENWKPVMLSALRYACHVDALAEVVDGLPVEFDPRKECPTRARRSRSKSSEPDEGERR